MMNMHDEPSLYIYRSSHLFSIGPKACPSMNWKVQIGRWTAGDQKRQVPFLPGKFCSLWRKGAFLSKVCPCVARRQGLIKWHNLLHLEGSCLTGQGRSDGEIWLPQAAHGFCCSQIRCIRGKLLTFDQMLYILKIHHENIYHEFLILVLVFSTLFLIEF